MVGQPDRRAGAVSKTERTRKGMGFKCSAYLQLVRERDRRARLAWKATRTLTGLGFDFSAHLH
jgi:hypothetical protein